MGFAHFLSRVRRSNDVTRSVALERSSRIVVPVLQLAVPEQVPAHDARNQAHVSSIRLPAPQRFAGAISVPGDKSISHRAVLFAALAQGTTTVRNCNAGTDVGSSIGALRALGIAVDGDAPIVRIVGAADLADPAATVDCGNSGTTMRLLMGMLAGRVNAVLDGDASLRRRPMERVAAPLRAMGARIECAAGGVPPVRVAREQQTLRGIVYELPVDSAQVKTALLLAALRASEETTIVSQGASRDHSELMLRAMGAPIVLQARSVRVQPSRLRSLDEYEVPGDLSAAAYFVAAATCLPGSRISVLDTGINPTRAHVLDVLRDMGAHIGIRSLRERYGEPSADLEVVSASPLRGVELDPARIPNVIDDIPLLCAVAAVANGSFVVRGAEELRVKESDRIASTVELLRAFGVAVSELPDGLAVRGGRPLRPPERIDTGGDHRIGMTAAVLAAAARAPLIIDDADCIATSYPGFEDAWRAAFARES
jgi:3-phosphoshikimate 1-carboxyvinyltransferase